MMLEIQKNLSQRLLGLWQCNVVLSYLAVLFEYLGAGDIVSSAEVWTTASSN